MLTDDMVPVLIDFGFAEYYDSSKDDAFISNLAYGTPEVRYIDHPTVLLFLS